MKKLGFSLIEVLLVLGIIAVVTAMGFSITQKSIERAYNQYWYTGFKALWDATRDYESSLNGGSFNAQKYAENIKNLINGAKLTGSSTYTITAPNGISYYIVQPPNLQFVAITMTLPETKQAKSKLYKTQFRYYYSYIPTVLCPGAPQQTDYLDLRNRKDLLPFYVKGSTTNGVYSFQEAYCRVNDNTSNIVPDCNLVNTSDQNQGGVFYPANPRKVY